MRTFCDIALLLFTYFSIVVLFWSGRVILGTTQLNFDSNIEFCSIKAVANIFNICFNIRSILLKYVEWLRWERAFARNVEVSLRIVLVVASPKVIASWKKHAMLFMITITTTHAQVQFCWTVCRMIRQTNSTYRKQLKCWRNVLNTLKLHSTILNAAQYCWKPMANTFNIEFQ